MSFFVPHFGYTPDAAHTEQYVRSLPYPRLARDLPHLLRQRTKRDVFLWRPLLAVKSSWQRGAQGIGDCVSWGAELVATLLMAMQHVARESQWIEEAATEAIYGGCRVEALGQRFGGYDDGAAGSWAAEWLNDYGVLCRIDYSPQTGNLEHDLREYSDRKAKEWGNYGCGGAQDKGVLDNVARQHPIQEVTQVKTPEEAAAAIDAGCPLTIASMIGFGQMRRNNEGIVRRGGTWPHQMCLGGVKYTPGGEPLFRIFQSWGKSCSGPDPGVEHAAVSDCSWWAVADDVAAILRADDSFAFSRVAGFALPPWDFARNWIV